jgi:hypothetical protein
LRRRVWRNIHKNEKFWIFVENIGYIPFPSGWSNAAFILLYMESKQYSMLLIKIPILLNYLKLQISGSTQYLSCAWCERCQSLIHSLYDFISQQRYRSNHTPNILSHFTNHDHAGTFLGPLTFFTGNDVEHKNSPNYFHSVYSEIWCYYFFNR